MLISWIIPCYNEEERIEKTVREVEGYLKARGFEHEIIIVDNNSRDKTKEVVLGLIREIPSLRLVDADKKGKGGAVKLGMAEAKGEIRLFADADNSVSPDHLDKFLPLLCTAEPAQNCYDVVIGSIEIAGAVVNENAQWYRRALGSLSKYIIRAISGLWDIHDSQRGFKVFTKRAAESIFPRQTLLSWGFDFEILLIARKNGFRIKEVPVVWINPPGSKVNLRAYITTFMELLQVRMNAIRGLYD